MKKLPLSSLILFFLTQHLIQGASNENIIPALFHRCKQTEYTSYFEELRVFLKTDDTSGAWRFLQTAHWEETPLVSILPGKSGTLKVMRASTEEDARKIQRLGTIFVASGLRGDDKWISHGEVREFGSVENPIILIRIEDALVSLSEFGPLPEEEKKLILRFIEGEVTEWKKRQAAPTGE